MKRIRMHVCTGEAVLIAGAAKVLVSDSISTLARDTYMEETIDSMHK